MVQYLETHNEQLKNVLNIRIVVVFFTDWVVRCLSNLQSFASGKLFLGRMFFLAAEKARQFATAAGSDRSYSYRDAPVAWFLTNRYFERWRVGICEPTPNFENLYFFFKWMCFFSKCKEWSDLFFDSHGTFFQRLPQGQLWSPRKLQGRRPACPGSQDGCQCRMPPLQRSK